MQELGKGGFGTVYLAQDSRSGKYVAVKVEQQSKSSYLLLETLVYRYLKNSVFVLDFLEFGYSDGYNYIVF